jgi:hypothetical protein
MLVMYFFKFRFQSISGTPLKIVKLNQKLQNKDIYIDVRYTKFEGAILNKTL